MQFLALNQGYTEFNHLVRHIKYDKIISLHNITLISETMTWGQLTVAVAVCGTEDEYCFDHKNTKNWRDVQCLLGMS
jgi:hypothetical protein